MFGPEWPHGYTRAIVNRVMAELVNKVQKASTIVEEMGEGARAILTGRA